MNYEKECDENLICGKCKNKLQWKLDTLVCPTCNFEIILEISFIERDMKKNKKETKK